MTTYKIDTFLEEVEHLRLAIVTEVLLEDPTLAHQWLERLHRVVKEVTELGRLFSTHVETVDALREEVSEWLDEEAS